jgi:hypothetical protein
MTMGATVLWPKCADNLVLYAEKNFCVPKGYKDMSFYKAELYHPVLL